MFHLSKLFLVSFFAFMLSTTLFASLPEHVISASPAMSTVDVVKDSRVIISFDKPIIKHSNIDITNNKDKINGDTFIVNDTFLEFVPSNSLGDGLHQVSINPVTLESNPATYEPNGFFQKAAYRICKIFYNKKINQCPLIKYVDTKTHHIETEAFSYHFSTLPPEPTIKSLNLSISKDELPIGDSATLLIEAVMDDNETKVIDSDIEWIINKPALVSIDGLTLSTLDEGEVTLQANHKNTLSHALHVNIYKEINGYRLPPEPDPTINNSTILGIDSNGNGVRDDVERWIYARYDTYIPCVEHEINVTITDGRIVKSYETICEDTPVPYHQIVREIAMQAARAAQIIIDAPERARETTELESAVIQCEGYFSVYAIDNNHKLIPNNEDIGNSKEFNGLQYNTTERTRAYAKYNYNLSGGVYSVNTDINIMKESCDFDVDALLEVQP